ncbi:glycosyltransferase [Aliarcobacter butzleri]|uniref:glycosyltransferase n=2 Tax=Aliarcobacter butzleri TaxID=28197 RepID=UPI0002295C49|nr:glycosyltransferase [Aliarcobacter butzleri]BAK70355.1 glycosyltransferase [Aliarcobacter butzleri ED-1]
MKIIINTTNLKIGGALQVAISFINECINFDENEYFIFLSPSMSKEIEQNKFPNNFKFYTFKNPSRFILFDKTINDLYQEEKKINPDIVFSVFGPTYWKPKSKHIMGFANGLYLYDESPYFKSFSFFDKIKFTLKKEYHRLLLKRNADFYVLQTEDMKKRFSHFLKVDENKMFVVSSRYDAIFEKEIKNLNKLPSKKDNEFWFITISAFYPHKRLDLINYLVPFIKKGKLNIKFVLTLNNDVIEKHFSNVKDYIINLGPIKLEECPYVYSKCDALFLPTLIESFTASYPEAMIMQKPILTSHYSFAKTVCKNAALYFDPYDIKDIMEQIKNVYNDKELYANLVAEGLYIVQKLPSSNDRAKQYLNLCKRVVNNV